MCWLVEERPDIEAAFLDAVAAGEFEHLLLAAADITRRAELVRSYADLPLGAVDASVIALAERLKLTDVSTLDRRHFTVVRPKHTDALKLLPRCRMPGGQPHCPCVPLRLPVTAGQPLTEATDLADHRQYRAFATPSAQSG